MSAGFEFRPHHCFACGTLNEHGLRLTLHLEPGVAWIETSLDRRFEGWEGIAHGGITTTILDEVMAWSVISSDAWGVTARMQVDFRRPVPIGRAIRATGRLVRDRRRLFDTEAELVDGETGEVLARASGTYAAATGERRRELRERYGFRFLTDPPGAGDPDAIEALR
jgi:acyl-coenzyme A thioesterase PaaI-like protein